MSIYNTLYDVVVAGGGPSGAAAAIAAARNNARVLLIERYGFLGGMLTNASVPVFCPFSDGEKAIVRGVGLEIFEKMKALSWENPFKEENNGINSLDWVPVNPEILKRLLDELVLESGCSLLLHSWVIDVEKDNDTISSIKVASKEGTYTIKSKLFIDCTGDADLVAKAGGQFEYGDEDGYVQGVTLCFRLANVDGKKFNAYKHESKETGNLNLAVNRAKANGDFPFDERSVATLVLQDWTVAGLNFGHIYKVNPLRAEDLSRAEVDGRRMIPGLVKFLKDYVPGMENAVLASTGPFIGIRESRRILGEYRLTKKDYLERASFNDSIARYAYPIDIHASTPGGILDEDKDDFYTLRYKPGESYGIPYRSLLPIGLKNILAAGRTISADRAMHGSLRVSPACFATGQAAGTAAALCIKAGVSLRAIDIKRLQLTLTEQGACL